MKSIKKSKYFLTGGVLFEDEYFDLIFLDIDLKSDLNGLDIAKELRRKNKTSSIIIVTNLAQYAIKGYEIDAMAFCVKPLSYADFYMQMQKFTSRYESRTSFKVVIDEASEGKKIIVKSDDIYYIDIQKHYLNYHTKNGNFTARGNIKDCYNSILGFYHDRNIKNCPFFRINTGVIVNIAYISALDNDVVIVNNNRLSISRSNKKEFLSVFSEQIGDL